MKKILSAALCASLIASSSGLLEAAEMELSAQSDPAGFNAALLPQSMPADFSFESLGQDQMGVISLSAFWDDNAGPKPTFKTKLDVHVFPNSKNSSTPVISERHPGESRGPATWIPSRTSEIRWFGTSQTNRLWKFGTAYAGMTGKIAGVTAGMNAIRQRNFSSKSASNARLSVEPKISQAATIFKAPSEKDIMKDKGRQDAFWEGSKPDPNVASQPGIQSQDKNTASKNFERRTPSLRKALAKGAGMRSFYSLAAVPALIPTKALAGTVHLAPIAHLTSLLPYLRIGGVVFAAYLGARLTSRVINRIGKERSWSQDRISLYKSLASFAAVAVTIVLSLPLLGVSLNHIVAGAGVTGVILSVAAGDLINNFFESGRVMLFHPFGVGDRIKIGGQEYDVASMGWHDLKLVGPEGETPMPYTVLSQSPIIVLRKAPDLDEVFFPIKGRLKILSGAIDFFKNDIGLLGFKSFLITLAAYAAVVATTYLRFSGPFAWLAPFLTPVHAVAIIAATFATSKIIQRVLRSIGQRLSWPPGKTMVRKDLVQASLWITGGGLALKALGTSWGALGASIGFISLGVGLVTQNILSGIWRWILIRFGRLFGFNCSLKIGDAISNNGVRGIVTGINPYYLVLTLEDGKKAYLHYSIIFPFTKLSHAGPATPTTENADR